MSIKVEVQDQTGGWHKFQGGLPNSGPSIKRAMETAMKQSPLAKKSKKVRAVDEKTGSLVDMLMG